MRGSTGETSDRKLEEWIFVPRIVSEAARTGLVVCSSDVDLTAAADELGATSGGVFSKRFGAVTKTGA
jgi:hypothetical protein